MRLRMTGTAAAVLLAACHADVPAELTDVVVVELSPDQQQDLCEYYARTLDNSPLNCDGLMLDFDPGLEVCLENLAETPVDCALTVAEFDACYQAMDADPCWFSTRPSGCEAYDVCFPLPEY